MEYPLIFFEPEELFYFFFRKKGIKNFNLINIGSNRRYGVYIPIIFMTLYLVEIPNLPARLYQLSVLALSERVLGGGFQPRWGE